MGKILWLASYPKSGNTWLRVFLHNYFTNTAEPFDINEMSRLTMMDSDTGWYSDFDSRPVTTWTKDDVAVMRPRANKAAADFRADSMIMKTHNALVADRGTPMIAMEHTAAAIYIVRNPLDIVTSWAAQLNLTVDETISLMETEHQTNISEGHVYEYRGSWSTHVKSWTQRQHAGLHVMRYEDALKNPLETFQGVINFLGLPMARKRLQRAVRFSSFDNLRSQEEAHGFKERLETHELFFREGKAGQWRDRLSPAQARRVCTGHAEQMTRFNYVPADA